MVHCASTLGNLKKQVNNLAAVNYVNVPRENDLLDMQICINTQ